MSFMISEIVIFSPGSTRVVKQRNLSNKLYFRIIPLRSQRASECSMRSQDAYKKSLHFGIYGTVLTVIWQTSDI